MAPLVPAAGYTSIAIGAVFAFIFLWVFDKVWRNSIGAMMERIGNTGFGGIAGHGGVKPLYFLVKASHAVEDKTRLAMAASEHAIVYGFGAALWAFYDLAFTIAKTAYDFNTAIDNLWAHVTHGTTKIVRETVVKPTRTAIRYTDAKITARVHTLEGQVHSLTARIARTAHATAGAIAAPFPRIGRLEKTVKAQTGRITRLEKLLAAGLGVAVVARALGRLRLGWLRCQNVGKVGKRLCGMNTGLLDALLESTLLIVGTISLVEFAKEVGTVTEEASDLIHGFLRDA